MKQSRPLAPRYIFRAWCLYWLAANAATLLLLLRGDFWLATVFFLSPAPWLIFQILHPRARSIASAVTRFETRQREVWLTLDDGPSPETTPAMLDQLDAYNAKATFFLVGKNVDAHPELAAEIVRRGHSIGNHTHRHSCWGFWCSTPKKAAADIDACTDSLAKSGAGDTGLFRPPVGIKSLFLPGLLAERNLDLILWNARGLDGSNRPPDKVMARLLPRIHPGAIILLHENQRRPDTSRKLLGDLLEHLFRAGYRCVIPPASSFRRDQGVMPLWIQRRLNRP